MKPKWPQLSRNSLLLGIIFLATAGRIASAFYQGNRVEPLPGIFDQISYHNLAVRVLEGHGFSFGTGWWPATPAGQPTAHWSFLYTLFLSATYLVFGVNPVVARVIQATLTGILQPFITWRIGQYLFGPRVGLVSALLTGFYGYFLYYAGALVTESFFILALLVALNISIILADASNREWPGAQLKPWLYLGIAFGTAGVLRQAILPIIPMVLAWISWRIRRQRHPANGRVDRSAVPLRNRLLLTIAVLAAYILPWTIRNYLAFGEFVLLNTNAGFAFFWGNHPIHGAHFVPILPASEYGTLIPADLQKLDEARLDRALLQRGVSFVSEEPLRYFLLSVSRAKEFCKFWPSQESSVWSNLVRVLSFGLFLPFLLAGVLQGICHQRRRDLASARSAVILLLLVCVVYSSIHLATWTLVRYRLPVDAVLMPFAALSVVNTYDWVFGKTHTATETLGSSAVTHIT